MKLILDCSNIVHGGYHGTPNYRISGFPMGGIRKLLGIINAEGMHKDIALCFDGGKTIKKELHPTYKAGRVPNYAVIAQLDLLQDICRDCGIPFYKSEGYEADDYIVSLVQFLRNTGSAEDIEIISDDRDLACCVDRRTSIKNATSQGISINYDSYEERVVKGERIPYNMILLYKMFYGDRSDHYYGVSIPGLRFDLMAQFYFDMITPLIENGTFPANPFTNIAVMKGVIDNMPDLSEQDRAKLKKQAELVFPRQVDVLTAPLEGFVKMLQEGSPRYLVDRAHLKFFSYTSIDSKKFDMYCSAMHLNKCKVQRQFHGLDSELASFKELLSIKAKDLSNGVLAVEHHRSKRALPISSKEIEDLPLPL